MKSHDRCETSTNGGHRNRRRRYVINPAFQWKYTITIALTVFLICSALSSVLYGVLHEQARLRLMNPQTYTAEVAPVMFLFGVFFSAVTAGALGFWCLVATHRICGPMFVLERYLAELATGRLPKLRALRRKDEFKDLYATFSGAMQSLETKKQEELAVLSQARRIARSGLDGDDEARREALDAVATHLDRLHQATADTLGGYRNHEPAVQPVRAASTDRTPVAVT